MMAAPAAPEPELVANCVHLVFMFQSSREAQQCRRCAEPVTNCDRFPKDPSTKRIGSKPGDRLIPSVL